MGKKEFIMKTNNRFLSLAAGVACLVFTFSCSSGSDDSPSVNSNSEDSNSSADNGNYSSSGTKTDNNSPSSSNSENDGYSSSSTKTSDNSSSSSNSESGSSSSSSSSSTKQSSSSIPLKECTDIFNPANKFCYDGVVYDRCNGKEYNPTNQKCESNIVKNQCGADWYNPATENCCGNNKYTIATQFCSGNNVYSKCDGMEYPPTTHICSGGIATPATCNGITYNPLEQRCQSNIVETKCGANWYNSQIQGCCVSSIFSLANQRCENSVIETKCGTSYYNAANTNFKCENNVIKIKCGTGSYYHNPATQFCNGNNVFYKCNGSNYTPTTEYCSNGTTVKTYGSLEYSGQTYKTVVIGTQIWMAENLNYNVTGSICYNNSTSYCAQYGRLYNWATAMAFASNCNSNVCAPQVQEKHKGICPDEWHIPSDAEWNILAKYIDPNWTNSNNGNVAGIKLKATSGWFNDGNGTDNYGFTALPSGTASIISGTTVFASLNSVGVWWSSTEDIASNAYNRRMMYNYEFIYWNGIGEKIGLSSIRCIHD
jgi:uncharacterized protein (TIGR02145 family)